MKSSVDEIRRRFDADVERFSNLETGQSSTIDAPLALELIVRAGRGDHAAATHLLDVGAGAGNYTLKMLEALPGLDVTLIDLSRPMLDRAESRVLRDVGASRVTTLQGDVRELALGESRFDLITAAAVLHHLRSDEEWEAVFASFLPRAQAWRLALDLRPRRAHHPRRAGHHVAPLRRVPHRAARRGVSGSRLRVRRARGFAAPARLSARPVASRRLHRRGRAAQEQLLRRLRRGEADIPPRPIDDHRPHRIADPHRHGTRRAPSAHRCHRAAARRHLLRRHREPEHGGGSRLPRDRPAGSRRGSRRRRSRRSTSCAASSWWTR